jgi:NAD(P)-dependent dehydrogenase (short-subunit alcohol dehydrogenase family)
MRYRAKPADGIVWITGASSGIGYAVALELANRGFEVAVTARRAAALAHLTAAHPRISAFPGDVTQRDKMAALVTEIETTKAPIALAFLNAGVSLTKEREGFYPDLIDTTFDVNFGGTVNCLAPLLAAMRQRRAGQIAITSSIAGYGGIPGSLAYCASKAALISMAQTLRMTEAEVGITVQVVNPGFVVTEMTKANDYFDMPFLMSAEAAAKRICDGFEHGGFEISFPRRLAWFAKALSLLPYPLFFPAVLRVTRRARKPNRLGAGA